MNLRCIVLCGPSGVGKSTLLKQLLIDFNKSFGFSVSHTTRKPRSGEENGKHYFFVTREEMQSAINSGEFIEYAEYSGNLYGTSRHAVEDVCISNKICILDIEIEGVKQVKKSGLNPKYIFIRPPSLQDLEKRLRGRKTENEESLIRRLNTAQREIAYGEAAGNFDLVIVNDDVEQAYTKLKEFLLPEIEKLNC